MFLALRMVLYLVFGALAGQGVEFLTFDPDTGTVQITFQIDNLASILVGGGGFGLTFLSSFMDRVRGPRKA